MQTMPTIDEFEENIVFIAGIPIVGADLIGKLRSVLKKVLEKLEPGVKLFIPPTLEGGSMGVLLTEWPDSRSAAFAVKSLDGYSFDRNHTFTARFFTDMKKLEAPSDHWETPVKSEYTDVGDLWWWLQNERCRDQFAISHDKLGVPTVGVFTNMKGNDPELAGDPDKAETNMKRPNRSNFPSNPPKLFPQVPKIINKKNSKILAFYPKQPR